VPKCPEMKSRNRVMKGQKSRTPELQTSVWGSGSEKGGVLNAFPKPSPASQPFVPIRGWALIAGN